MRKFLTIEPNLGRFEESYRQAFLKSDALQAIFVMGLSNIVSLTLVASDYESYGMSAKFYMFLGARGSVFLLSIAAIIVLSKSSIPKHHDWAVASYMIAGGLINIFINSVTSSNYVAYTSVSIVLIHIYYFALFTPIFFRASIAHVFSIVVVVQALQSPLSADTKSVILGMHLLTNIFGLIVSARLYTHRRLSFKAHAEETEMKLEMVRLANVDYLTDVKNRRAFSNEALEEFNRAKRYQRQVSLIIIDIDNLKSINDMHGHLAGDETIKHCASTIAKQIREQDIFGRLGGDEFGLLLPETKLTEAIIVGKRIQQKYMGNLVLSNGEKIDLSLSGGIAEILESDQSFDDLFRRADQLLYNAKNNGRSQIVFDSVILTE